MRAVILGLLAILFAVASVASLKNGGKQWVLLVAGSRGYSNYRHQSDVYHAYQIFKRFGIPSEQLITMQYDDVANSPSNPKPGKVFNTIGGPDVYAGFQKDYTGNDVTAANFMKILSGQDMTGVGTGKTIKSGPNDEIFVAFFDHGAPGLIAMPVGGYLYAKDLMSTLKSMYSNKQYDKMVLYIEACESGSMFNGLLSSDMNIYATTAANPFQSSYACDYQSDVRAYLNDCYSRNWMVDTEAKVNATSTYTLDQQYATVKQLTTESHVCKYGDSSMGSELLTKFMVNQNSASKVQAPRATVTGSSTPLSSRDVHESFLKQQVATAQTNVHRLQAAKELKQFYEEAARADVMYGAFAHELKLNTETPVSNDDDHCNSRSAVIDPECTKAAYEAHNAACGMFTEYSIKYGKYVASACQQGHSVEKISAALNKVCGVVRN